MNWKAALAGILIVGGLACRDTTRPEQDISAKRSAAVPGEYIVVFRPQVSNPAAVAAQLIHAHGGTLRFTYTSAIKGFAAKLPPAAVEALARNPNVAYVEPDQEYRVDVTQTMNANGDPWGLDRVDQQALPLSRTYTYTATGSGVHAYIIDTGIWTLHADFGGRANNVYDAFAATGEDCHGHGTHVAGTIGGTTYGLAKGASLHGVRVLSCAGLGLTSQIIAGIDWVRANAIKPAVANMSLGGGLSTALNDATTNLWNSGVFVAVAAGNDDADACTASPASATGAFTAAASEKTDAKASYSNWGSCVEAYAPGSAIVSAFLAGTTMSLSGTSMASPHFAGVAVLYKATFGDAPSGTVSSWIVTNATNGVITGNPAGTPNKLLFKSTL
ncbi:MAG: S8 family peptidase [Gemmatimonadales bacterium]